MAHSKLLVRPDLANAHGCVHQVTPASAGWTYVGFEVHDLQPGDSLVRQTGDFEICIVIVSGRAGITAGSGIGSQDFGILGKRLTPFEGGPWSVYVPAKSSYTVVAATKCEIAICAAPATGALPARNIASTVQNGDPG